MSSGRTADGRVTLSLGSVQQTLLVPLWARAMEATQPVPLLHDPQAAVILARLDFDFARLSSARASQLGCCVRARLFDSWTGDFLRQHPTASVVELGVGLNSRSDRVDSADCHWFEVDFADVIALRRKLFAAHLRRSLIAGDLRALDWLAPVASRRQPTLILAEGVLVYLEDFEVRALLLALRQRLPGAVLVFDAMAPAVVALQGLHDAMRHFAARFRWALPSLHTLKTWDPQLQLLRSQRFFDLLYAHPQRLPRWLRVSGPPLARLWPAIKDSYMLAQLRIGGGADRPDS